MTEAIDIERKTHLDLDEKKHSLDLVLEIAAMANTEGGRILIGAADSGEEIGIDEAMAAKFDPARVGDLIDRFLTPDRLEIRVEKRPVGSGQWLVEIVVPAADDPPLVLAKQGNFQTGSTQKTRFAAHSVYVRRNTKAEPARREDFRAWRAAAVNQARQEILDKVNMVMEASPDAHIRIVEESGVTDAPSYFLSRSSDVFQQRPDRLLSGDDLVYLWNHRGSLRMDPVAQELIIQSALRRRATLYFWLATLEPSADEVKQYLYRALQMKDRDKSDAGRSIPIVASLYLSEDDYIDLISQMRSSKYAHIERAAMELPSKESATKAISDNVNTRIDGQTLSAYRSDELLERAKKLDPTISNSRRLAAIGLEYLRRKLGLA